MAKHISNPDFGAILKKGERCNNAARAHCTRHCTRPTLQAVLEVLQGGDPMEATDVVCSMMVGIYLDMNGTIPATKKVPWQRA